MSAITLVTVEGYGDQGKPRVPGTAEHVLAAVNIPEGRDIAALIHVHHEPDGASWATTAPVVRSERVNDLVGKVLTLVDSSNSDATQRKAQKTLFLRTIWDWYEAQTADVFPARPVPGADAQHVVPRGDAVEHRVEADGECVCRPHSGPVERGDGTVGQVVVHHSFDGREAQEA